MYSISLSCETRKSTSKQPNLLLRFFFSKGEDEPVYILWKLLQNHARQIMESIVLV